MTIKKQLFTSIIISFLTLNIVSAQEVEFNFDRALDLQTCIEYAKKSHPLNKVSESSLGVSESQLKQAHSAYWPQVGLSASVSTMDESPNFIFPASKFEIPSLGIPGIQLAPIDVPEQNVKLFDKTLVTGSVDVVYPIYTGGYISSLVGQAEGGLLIAKEDARKNELQIISDVKKRFFAVYITEKLKDIGDETLARLETTLELTENLYLKGSGKVTKTDFLKNKIMVENVRSINSTFKHNLHLAKQALLNALGEKVGQDIKISFNESEEVNKSYNFDELLSDAFANNPTWKTLEAAQNIFEKKVDEAYSGHLPKVGIKGSFNYLNNSYEYGLVSDVNKYSWTVALGMELPIFNGFRTSAQVDEANYKLEKIKHQRILLENGLGIMVKKALVDYQAASDQKVSLRSAMETAIENQELNDRAYQSDLVELQDLMEAQLFEAIMEVQYYNALYKYYETLADLEFTVGKGLE